MPRDKWGEFPELGDRRVLRPGRYIRLRAIGWLVFSVFVVALTFGIVGQAIADLTKGGSELWMFAGRCAALLIVLLAYALLVRFGEGRYPSEVAAAPAAPHALAGLAIGVAMFSLTMLVLVGSGLYEFRFVGWRPAWSAASISIEAGIVEEILVRGLLLRLAWRAFGPKVAFAISAAAFGLGHLANPNATVFAVVCIALEAGIMLGAFYALTGRLWASIGVHAGWNFAQGYIFGAAVSGEKLDSSAAVSTARARFPDWLTGGPFGPEASLPSVLVCSLVGGAILWLAYKQGRFDSRPDRQIERQVAEGDSSLGRLA